MHEGPIAVAGWALAAALCATHIASPAGQGPTAPQEQSSAQPTFRTSTDLVVIDAVVVDSRGRHVRDLTAADFEVVQSGRRMPVRHAVYVDAAAPAPRGAAPAPAAVVPTRPDVPAVSSAVRPSIGEGSVPAHARIIAVVVDDLGLSWESTVFVRRALRKFVDEQVRHGDLVAVLRTSAGAGALQQFTTDKRLVHAAVDRVRWTVLSRSGVTAFTPASATDLLGDASAPGSGTAEADNENTIEGLRTQLSAIGSLGALEFVIRGVESLPGRKSVVFVSEGMRLFERPKGLETAGSGRVWNAFTRVMDRANRAGVVVYTMDARGLATAGLTAEDDPRAAQAPFALVGGPAAGGSSVNKAAQAVLDAAMDRRRFLLDSQEALTYIAEQTGGFAVLNTNDLNLGFERVLDDLAGYYLIGYEGAPEKMRTWDPGRVTIRVNRAGLRVRSRKGLFGPSDAGRPREPVAGDPLLAAAMSPFGASTLDVRATGLFAHHPKEGSFVRSLFFIDPAGIDFLRRDDGKFAAQITVVLLTLDDEGRMAAHARRLLDLELEPDTYRAARERGILYNLRIPVTRAGAYQLRAVARDERTDALGTSSQFVEIPEVGVGRLALSSIVLRAAGGESEALESADAAAVPDRLDAAVYGEPWVRIFRRGSDAVYTYEIYDGVSDGRSMLTTTATLSRDGRVLYRGPVSPLRSRDASDAVRVAPVAGRLSFSAATDPGTYTLQVTVTVTRDGQVRGLAHQWASFVVR